MNNAERRKESLSSVTDRSKEFINHRLIPAGLWTGAALYLRSIGHPILGLFAGIGALKTLAS